MRLSSTITFAFLGISLLLPNSNLRAQRLAAELSSEKAYVGHPIVLRIQMDNPSNLTAPEIPRVDGIDVELAGSPSQSSQVTIINGQRSESSTVLYQYYITPRRSGSFTIPGIEVVVGGVKRKTIPLSFTASVSEPGDLMFVEMVTSDKQVYVGQPIKLTLQIWIKPFTDTQRKIQLSEGNMWQLVRDRSNWGSFQQRVEELSYNNRRPAGEEVQRKLSNGDFATYYLYEIDTTIYPQRAGDLEPGKVQISMEYPTEIGESGRRRGGLMSDDDFFGGSSMLEEFFSGPGFRRNSLSITGTRPIAVDATIAKVNVIDVPSEGRPRDYRGAVGKYQITTQASPTSVAAGDPINLQIIIRGDGPMDLVQAPPLSQIESIEKDFIVEEDNLAGLVQGNAKLFSTTVRPKNETVSSIPPIPFTFFDAVSGRFETVYSQPIPIGVKPADILKIESIGGESNEKKLVSSPVTPTKQEATLPFPTIYSAEQILNPTRNGSFLSWWYWFVSPPIIFFILLLWLNRLSLSSFLFRFRSPASLIISQIKRAHSPSELAIVLRRASTQCLASDIAHPVISRCEAAAYSPTPVESIESLRQSAIDIIRANGAKFNNARQPSFFGLWRGGYLGSLTLSSLFLLCTPTNELSAFIDPSFSPNMPPSLSESQLAQILKESEEYFTKAVNSTSIDNSTRKKMLGKAINGYLIAADCRAFDDRIYSNLGTAYWHLDEHVKALANYEQAYRLNPYASSVKSNLAFVRSKIAKERATTNDKLNWLKWTQNLLSELNWYINPIPTQVAYKGGWLLLWGCGCLTLFFPSSKTLRICLIIGIGVSALGMISYVSYTAAEKSYDGISLRDIELREADGETFAVTGSLMAGEQIESIEHRGEWALVRSAKFNASGWLKHESIFVLKSKPAMP